VTEAPKGLALLAALAATLAWSSSGILIKWTPGHPLAICSLRSLVAIPALLPFVRRARFTGSLPQIGAAVAYATTMISFVFAVKLTTAANAVLLQYTAPIYVALLGGWLLGERASWQDWLTIAVVLGGLALFFLDRLALSGLTGNLLAVGSGFSFALQLIFLRRQKGDSPLESILLGNAIAAAVGLPFAVRFALEPQAWPGIVLMGLFLLSLPFLLYVYALRRITAVEAVLVKGLEPILGPLWVYLLIGESPGRWALAGGAIVFLAITARGTAGALRSRKKPARG
jgi:drug/metabolite transporter (DMT)-like permease